MVETFERIKDLALELGLAIEKEIPEEEILIVNDPDRGISQMVIDCEDTILVIEQLIFEIDSNKFISSDFFSGKKPQKKYLSENPLIDTAALTAEGPGTG